MIKQKKAQVESLFMLGLIIMVVIVGAFIVVVGSGILTFTGDTINDITSQLGVEGDTNLSHASDVSIGVVNQTIQMLTWGSGLLLFFSLLGILLFAVSIRLNPSGFTIGLYILMVIVFVITAIYMSNTYQEFASGTDEIALELKGMVMANFLLNFLPHIITVIAFIGGIIIFTGIGEEFN